VTRRTRCLFGAVLLGAGFGALSGGFAAHVARERWEPAWTRRLAVGIVPTRGRGVALMVRFAF